MGDLRKRHNRRLLRRIQNGLPIEEDFIKNPPSKRKRTEEPVLDANSESTDNVPPPHKAYSEDLLRNMFETGWSSYHAPSFWDGRDFNNLKEGTHCVYQVKLKMDDRVLIKHGEVLYWLDDDFVIVRSEQPTGLRKVHYSELVGDPDEEYCISAEGRCLKKNYGLAN